MNISNIAVWKENLELTRPYTIAYKTVSAVENAFVRIDLDGGSAIYSQTGSGSRLYGVGACNPSKLVVGESLDEAFSLLSAPATTEWLVGRDIRTASGLCREVQARFAHSAGVRAALDMALHDAFARFLGLPLVDVLGRRVQELPTSITIGIKSIAETLEEAQEYVDRKFHVIKVKTGSGVDEDVEKLTKLRERYGAALTIRIDSNQGYNAAQAVEFFERTKHLNIELNEQPIPAGGAAAIEAMRSLPEHIKQTIAADETLVTPDDAMLLAHNPRACGIFNIKLMKCGGVTHALDIARVAERTGIELMWGCNDESIVSITAALHAAFSSPATKYIDLDGSLDLARDAVVGGFILDNGVMRVGTGAGLGVELNEFR